MKEEVVTSILVPVDGSKNSYKAIDYASKLAKSTKATVTLLYVIDSCDEEQGEAGIPEGSAYVNDEIDTLAQYPRVIAAKEILDDALTVAGTFNVAPSRMIALGDVPYTIVDVATRHQFNMIVMGTRGHTTYRNKLMGHVSEIVAELAPCPVLLAR